MFTRMVGVGNGLRVRIQARNEENLNFANVRMKGRREDEEVNVARELEWTFPKAHFRLRYPQLSSGKFRVNFGILNVSRQSSSNCWHLLHH